MTTGLRVRLAATALAAVAVVGCGPTADQRAAAPPSEPASLVTAANRPPPSQSASRPAAAHTTPPGSSEAAPPAPSTPPAPERPTGVDPERIVIPAIDVDARVQDLSLAGDLPDVPEDWDATGWYTSTRNPGEIGPAVIAGHIDSKAGPAVFFRLDELRRGDEITVHGADGARRTFTVVGRGRYPKDDLPPEVFGFGGRRPELRLITCGGAFDRSSGHYLDNQVVYAAMTDLTI